MRDRKEPAPVIEAIYFLAVKIYTPEDPGTAWFVPVHPCCMCLKLLLLPMCGIILQQVMRSPAHDREGLLTAVLQKAGAQQSSLLGTTVPTRMPC